MKRLSDGRLPGNSASPTRAVTHIQPRADPGLSNHEDVRAVVLRVTVKVEATLPLTLSLVGKEHAAPVGAPVQESAAVPRIPTPPICRGSGEKQRRDTYDCHRRTFTSTQRP